MLFAVLLAAACDDYPPCGPEENGEWGPGGPNPGPTLPDPSTGASGPDRANVTYSTNDAGEVCECGPYALGCEPTPERAKMARSCRSAGEGRRNCLVGLDDPPAAPEHGATSSVWQCACTSRVMRPLSLAQETWTDSWTGPAWTADAAAGGCWSSQRARGQRENVVRLITVDALCGEYGSPGRVVVPGEDPG